MKVKRDKKNKKLTIFLISVVLSLPFWWGINALGKDISEIYFWQEISKNPEIFAAQAKQQSIIKQIKKLKKERQRENNFKKLKIDAKSAISVEINNNGNEKKLFGKKEEKRLPIASITKLMTALTVFNLNETYKLSRLIKISKKAVDQDGDSKWGGLKVGEKMSVKNLLAMALIESNNDAAFALTEPIGEKAFVNLMNINAKKIGMRNTHYFNPNGLEPDNPKKPINYSTATDLVKLARYIIKNYPQIFKITTNKTYSVLKPDGSLHHFIPENTDKLLGKVPGIIGGKTGWTPRASGCLLLALKNPNGNGYFVNVVLGSKDRFGDMEKIIRALEIHINK